VRLLVDEPGAARYQVPDILLPELETRRVAWQGAAAGKASWRGAAGPAGVELSYAPFKLTLSVGGRPAAVVNSRSLFAFEHRRNKTVRGGGRDWEEGPVAGPAPGPARGALGVGDRSSSSGGTSGGGGAFGARRK
jgi:hypothetical protein